MSIRQQFARPAKPSARLAQSLPAAASTAAILATHVYKKYEDDISLPDAWQQITTSDQLIGDTQDGFRGALYSNGKDFIIVFCGFFEARDLLPALEAGFAGLPNQLASALLFTQSAITQHNLEPQKIIFAGHSLGGYLARATAQRLGASAVYGFNSPGFKPGDSRLIEETFGTASTPSTHKTWNINSNSDIIGRWGHHAGEVIEIETSGNHHNMAVLAEALTRKRLRKSNTQDQKTGLIRLVAREICDKIGELKPLQAGLGRMFQPA